MKKEDNIGEGTYLRCTRPRATVIFRNGLKGILVKEKGQGRRKYKYDKTGSCTYKLNHLTTDVFLATQEEIALLDSYLKKGLSLIKFI